METTESLDDKDSGPEVQINIPNSVLNRIEELMGGTEQFDNADFDAVAYINRMFPTEQSLSGVEAATAKCQYRLAAVHEDIRQMVRSQPEQRCEGQKALVDAQETIRELAIQVGEINKKAGVSAGTVREITAEIKALDAAKWNLTAAITALNHAHMLAGALQSLRTLARRRLYADVVAPLQACMEVLQQLEVYRELPELGALRSQLMELRSGLARQLLADFRDALTGAGKSTISHKTLSDACLVVDVLDPEVKEELLDWLVNLQLQEYVVLFSADQEAAWLPSVERRYAWLKKHLLAFEDGPGALLPAAWRVSERVARAFCQRTREDLSALLATRAGELDVKLLLYAMQKTRAFETLLHRRFLGTEVPEGSELDDEPDPNTGEPNKQVRWVGAIGACFEPHLHLYIDSLDSALNALMQTFIQDASTPLPEDADSGDSGDEEGAGGGGGAGAGAGSVLASCAELFVFYKKCVLQCASLSTAALPQLAELFAKYLRVYSTRVLAAQLPRGGAAGPASLAPPALLAHLLRDDARGLSRADVRRVCRVLCTADYCAATARTLHDKLQARVPRRPLHALLPEQEQLQALTDTCISLLVTSLRASCGPALAAWRAAVSAPHCDDALATLVARCTQFVRWLARPLAAHRKYLTQFLLRLAAALLPDAAAALWAVRAAHPALPVERRLLLAHALKAAMLQLPSAAGSQHPPPATYTKTVVRLMARCENGLKWLMTPHASEQDALIASLSPQDIKLLVHYKQNN